MRKIFEIVTNLVVIIVGVAVLCALGMTYWHKPATLPLALRPGTHLPAIAGLDLSSAPQTLLLFMRKDCHFCEDSMPFYRRVDSKIKSAGHDTRLVALFPEATEDHVAFLDKEGLKIAYNAGVDFGRFSVTGTPTLILVDRTGTVQNSWVGKLPADKEEQIIKVIQVTSSTAIRR